LKSFRSIRQNCNSRTPI